MSLFISNKLLLLCASTSDRPSRVRHKLILYNTLQLPARMSFAFEDIVYTANKGNVQLVSGASGYVGAGEILAVGALIRTFSLLCRL